jgi:hypothetical protein
MPWFRVDDTLALHHKVLAAGNGAMGLWVRAGSWSMQQLTDGFIPSAVARTLGSAAEARSLVSVSLWDEVDGGYRFHEWEGRQPSREKVEADREAAAERQRHARERAKSRRESQRDNSVSHGPPDPTRPDPVLPTEVPVEAAPAKKATQRPPDFRPAQAHIDLANERGVDLRAEWAKFCDWCDANGKTYKDWPAALRNWIRNARPGPPTRATGQQGKADILAQQRERMTALQARMEGAS